ncbi:MAG: FGGY-family carbohydrate kinase [Planctomycetes bacterium]|nr:FGGY-family carbohydrate kinase [Planctomycetota bacterium]
MPDRILLAFDLGTTAVKGYAGDDRGSSLAFEERRLPVRVLPDGGREQEPASIDRACRSVARGLRARLGRRWRWVAGIGISAQGGSSMIADRETGEPLTPLYLWNDGRARAEARRLGAGAPHGLARMAWLEAARPDLFDPRNIHIGAGEYLFHRLTRVWRQDPGNAIQIGTYDAPRNVLHGRLLDRIGVPLSFVAPLRAGHETAPLARDASRKIEVDVPDGIPVAGPYIDQEGGFLSVAAAGGRPLQGSLGTAWVGNFVLPDDTTGASPTQLAIASPAGEGRLVIQPLLTGNVAWDWALRTFLAVNLNAAIEASRRVFEEALLPPEGVVALPWLAQPNLIVADAHGAGVFAGIGPSTERADLVRAMAAGLAFEMARVLSAVRDRGAVDRMVLTGGASRAPVFRTLLACLFAPLDVDAQDGDESAAARGALFAFGKDAARIRVERIPAPEGDLDRRIRRDFDAYRECFDRILGSLPPAGPFAFGEMER